MRRAQANPIALRHRPPNSLQDAKTAEQVLPPTARGRSATCHRNGLHGRFAPYPDTCRHHESAEHHPQPDSDRQKRTGATFSASMAERKSGHAERRQTADMGLPRHVTRWIKYFLMDWLTVAASGAQPLPVTFDPLRLAYRPMATINVCLSTQHLAWAKNAAEGL